MIIADQNIPFVEEAFSSLGEVKKVAAAEITPNLLRNAEALLVRSVTRVDKALLAKSSVKFVGTATIGVDHIDQTFLEERNIPFASAPGSNANSVSEWVTAALLRFAAEKGISLRDCCIGIVGVGNVGTLVKKKAEALGMKVMLNDPPRAESEDGFVSLEELLASSDIVTTHVPLERGGKYPTYHLVDAGFLRQMKPAALFLNSSRGKVVDEKALLNAIERGTSAILDVWYDEPGISQELLKRCFLGTPHIAGYSFDGKVAGTRMIYRAACQAFGVDSSWVPVLPDTDVPLATADYSGNCEQTLDSIVSQVYSIGTDDRNLRQVLQMSSDDAAAHFVSLRKQYPRRREFNHTRVEPNNYPADIALSIADLGFKV